MDEVAIVLLAAGRGTRFGSSPKLLGPLDGKPLVRHAAEAAVASGFPATVVLGAHAERVRAALEGLALDVVENPDHAAGLSTSLLCGLAGLRARAVIVMLGDMPRVTAGHLSELAATYREADPRPAAVVPVCAGKRGNPVLLDRVALGRELDALSGDHGAGRLLADRADVVEVAMDEAVRRDVDTRAALASLAAGR